MPVPSTVPSIQSETAALRRLAVGLLGDGDSADEVVQRTRIALWQRGGEPGNALVGGIVRNVAAHLRRDAHRRRRHESEAAARRTGHAASAEETLARHELVCLVADAVADLREPFRECVALRFYEDLPPRVIARRLGVPVSTIRSRVQRGLALMRGALDRRGELHGSWRSCLALATGVPLRDATAGTGTAILGTWIMSKASLIVAATALLILVMFGLWFNAFPGGAKLPSQRGTDASNAASATAEIAADRRVRAEAVAVIRRDAAMSAPRTVIAIDGSGMPVTGASVFAGPGSNGLTQLGTTDGLGQLPLPEGGPDQRFVLASGVGHSPSDLFDLRSRGGEVRLVLGDGPTGRITGAILDPFGQALPEARVYAGRGEPASPAQAARGLGSRTPGLVAVTDANGRFALDGVLAGWFRLIVRHDDYATLVGFHEMTADTALTLDKQLRHGVVVTGRVTTRAGLPAVGVSIEQGSPWGFETRRTTTDADGSFRTAPLLPGNKVILRDRNDRVRNAIRLPAGDEQIFVWSPTVGDGEVRVRGQVVATDRSPAGVIVRIGTRHDAWHDECRSGPDGEFEVALPKGRVFRVGVFGKAGARGSDLPILLRDIAIEAPDVPLRLDLRTGQGFGSITARLGADTPLLLMPEVDLAPTFLRSPAEVHGDLRRWTNIPGGAVYRVVADLGQAGSYAVARFVMPAEGEDAVLGDLILPTRAAVSFAIDTHPSAAGSTQEYLLERTDDNAALILSGVGSFPPGPLQLPVGRYRLDIELSPGGRRSIPFAVTGSTPMTIGVPVDARPDVAVEIRGLGRGAGAKVSITGTGWNTRETVEIRHILPATFDDQPKVTESRRIAPGDYRVDVVADDGRHTQLDVTILSRGMLGSPTANRVVVADGRIRIVVE